MEGNELVKMGGRKSVVSQLVNAGRMPDILDCIANLSSDEVFTPPELVDKMLDLFPDEVWHNPNLKWLDPACKTGIFLRQIAKRLMIGLMKEIPDEEERRRHIFQNMLYGIALTDLTALMSRRSVYTSKNADGEKSIGHFDSVNGNISYDNRPHTYKNGYCIYCGNKQGGILDRDETKERHAYNFIHLTEEEARNMKFDIIVGNPPYQLSDGGGGGSASPIYQLFVQQAKKLKPRYLAFIIPSRWFVGGKGLDAFRDEMISDRHIMKLVDYPNSNDCFPGVDIPGGVSYFIRDELYDGKCHCSIQRGDQVIGVSDRYLDDGGAGIMIRYPEMVNVLKKVESYNEETMDSIISSQKPFGLRTDFFKDYKKYNLPKIYETKEQVPSAAMPIYGLLSGKRTVRFVPLGYPFPTGDEYISKWKVLIPNAYGCSAIGEKDATPVLGTSFIAESPSACTETFLRIGAWDTEQEAKNMQSYLKTKFFRFLVGIKKTTQHTSRDSYSFVPLLDFRKSWTDGELYERYELSPEEIQFIEDNVEAM